jgi:hypothetical protein
VSRVGSRIARTTGAPADRLPVRRPSPMRTPGVARAAVHDLAGRAIIDANPEPVTVEASPTRS